jgi:capsular polysaccharide biosynthesis protein
MNETSVQGEVLKFLLTQAPVLLVSLVGLIVAFRFWPKAPTASLWAVAAFGLGILTCALVGVGQVARSDATLNFIGPILRAVTYLLLLIGVYAGRPSSSATPANVSQSLGQNVITAIRARPGLLAIFFTLFISVFLLVVITTTLVTFILPESFASTARIRLALNTAGPAGTTGWQGGSAMPDPRFVQTECEVIQSEGILRRVIEDLDLNKEWGKKYAGGDKLRTTESMELLKCRMDLRPVRDTSIIAIRVFSERPEEAAKVANAVAEAYRAYRREQPSQSGMVEIIDTAKPGLRPVRPNKPLNIALGMLMGVFLGLVVGGGVWCAGLMLGKKPEANRQR